MHDLGSGAIPNEVAEGPDLIEAAPAFGVLYDTLKRLQVAVNIGYDKRSQADPILRLQVSTQYNTTTVQPMARRSH